MRALYAAGCDEICVSLNAGDARSYATMMQTTGKNFDRVVENIRRAAALKRETGSDTVLRVQFLVYKENFRQLSEMYELFRETGADRFWLNGLYPVRPMPQMSEAEVAEMLAAYEEVLARDYFERLERFSFWEKSIAERIEASTRKVFAKAPLARRARTKLKHLLDAEGREARALAPLHEFCLVGWYSMTLNANGDAVTCCILQDHPTAVLGSIHESSLAEIWFGERYARFRAELSEIMARRGEVDLLLAAAAPSRACAPRRAPAPPAPTTGPATPPSAGSSTTWSRPCRDRKASPSRALPSGGRPRACPSTPASTSSRQATSTRGANSLPSEAREEVRAAGAKRDGRGQARGRAPFREPRAGAPIGRRPRTAREATAKTATIP